MARISGQGNIQAALDNLPAHIVRRFKVYDKAGEQSEQQSWKNNETIPMVSILLPVYNAGTHLQESVKNGQPKSGKVTSNLSNPITFLRYISFPFLVSIVLLSYFCGEKSVCMDKMQMI